MKAIVDELRKQKRIVIRGKFYNVFIKNQGGAAFNIINLNYDGNPSGNHLKQIDDDARVRAMLRSKVLDQKNNSKFNLLTGSERPPIPVPHHDRYNPILGIAGH